MRSTDLITLIICFVLQSNIGVAQSIFFGHGQAITRSKMEIPLVDGPKKAIHEGAKFFYITGTYPWRKWDILVRGLLSKSGAALAIEDGWYSYIAAQDMRSLNLELGVQYQIFNRLSRFLVVPSVTIGLQNSYTIRPNNDFDAFNKVNTPKYKEVSSEVETHDGTQLTGSIGLRLGVRIGKSRRLSVNINSQFLYAPKTVETIHFHYWSPPNPYDTLYARANGTTMGFYQSISIGYTIPFKKKKKKTVEKESLYYYEDKKLNITD